VSETNGSDIRPYRVMPDYVDVCVYPVYALPVSGHELLCRATAHGVSSTVLSLVPDTFDAWKSTPRVGDEYLVEGTAPAGARVRFVAACTVAHNRRDPAEFLIKRRA
jgi:hypothetical protein